MSRISTCFLFLAVAAAQCYNPDGTDRNKQRQVSGWYLPCNTSQPGGTHSMCCRMGGGGPSDACQSNGLCYNQGNGGVYWRESCTDPTWKDPSCIQLYINGTSTPSDGGTQTNEDNDVQVKKCDDGSWCTDTKNNNCCLQHKGFVLRDGSVIPASATSSASKTGSSSTLTTTTGSVQSASATNTAAATPVASRPASNGSQNGTTNAIIGGVVGGVLGLGVVVAGVVLCMRRQNKKGRIQDNARPTPIMEQGRKQHSPGTIAGYYEPTQPVYTATPAYTVHELSSFNETHKHQSKPVELPVH